MFDIPECFDVVSGKYHEEGTEWPAEEDPCVSCTCQVSHFFYNCYNGEKIIFRFYLSSAVCLYVCMQLCWKYWTILLVSTINNEIVWYIVEEDSFLIFISQVT